MIKSKNKSVAVIGAGPAGMQIAATLSQLGIAVNVFEKGNSKGGHLKNWHHLFPDFSQAGTLLNDIDKLADNSLVKYKFNSNISSLNKTNGLWCIKNNSDTFNNADAVVLATGFNEFNAEIKEEYGYGVYKQVITSLDLEDVFNGNKQWPFAKNDDNPQIGIVHCVGSRDAKCGNLYCSKVCCVTAVKQAIEIKKAFPNSSVYCFYMDMRMFGKGYEELYYEAQTKYNIQFIRGRLSEASPNINNTIQVKAEDTLMGRPVKLNLNMLVLMVGMTPSVSLKYDNETVSLDKPAFGDGFIDSMDGFTNNAQLSEPGLFAVGTCKSPASLPEVINDAKATAISVYNYLNAVK